MVLRIHPFELVSPGERSRSPHCLPFQMFPNGSISTAVVAKTAGDGSGASGYCGRPKSEAKGRPTPSGEFYLLIPPCSPSRIRTLPVSQTEGQFEGCSSVYRPVLPTILYDRGNSNPLWRYSLLVNLQKSQCVPRVISTFTSAAHVIDAHAVCV